MRRGILRGAESLQKYKACAKPLREKASCVKLTLASPFVFPSQGQAVQHMVSRQHPEILRGFKTKILCHPVMLGEIEASVYPRPRQRKVIYMHIWSYSSNVPKVLRCDHPHYVLAFISRCTC